MIKKIALACALTLTLFAGHTYAQDSEERQEVDLILDIAKGWGSANMDVDSAGDPLIVGRMDGTRYGILFYDCNDEKTRCRTMQFNAAWAGTANSLSLQRIHDLNKDNIFGKWYFDNDGDVAVKFAYSLAYGYERRNLDDVFDWWRIILKETKEAL